MVFALIYRSVLVNDHETSLILVRSELIAKARAHVQTDEQKKMMWDDNIKQLKQDKRGNVGITKQ